MRSLGVLIAAAVLVSSAAGSAVAQGLTVTALTVEGQTVQSVSGVQMRAPGAGTAQTRTLNAKDAIAPGTEIAVPRGARVELTSSNGNRITLYPGSRFMAGLVTGNGESHQPLGGRIDFQVRKALDFFNVQYDRITAAVKGTDYSVEIDPGQTFTLAVTEGVVEVEREVQIRFAAAPLGAGAGSDDDSISSETGIRVAEELKAGQRKTYRLNVEEYLAEFKNFAEAEDYFRKALALAEASKDRRRVLRGVINLMEMYWRTGRQAAVAGLEGRCIALAKALSDAWREGVCVRLVGSAYFESGEFPKALGYFERSLSMSERQYHGRDHAAMASSLNQVAITYRNLGEYRKAVEYNEKALAMRERLARGRDSAAVASSYNNLGRAYQSIGEPRKAIEYHDKALAMSERVRARRDHPDTAMAINHLGLAYGLLGEHRRAIDYHEKALAMRERIFAQRDHPHIADSYSNLGLEYFLVADYRTALEYHEKALAMRSRISGGRDSSKVAASLHNVGRTYDGLQDYRKAIEYLEKGLAMRRRVYGGDHAEIAGSLITLGRDYRLAGEPLKAIGAAEESLAMRERLFGPKAEVVAQSMRTLANAHDAAGNAGEAREYRKRALAIAAPSQPK